MDIDKNNVPQTGSKEVLESRGAEQVEVGVSASLSLDSGGDNTNVSLAVLKTADPEGEAPTLVGNSPLDQDLDMQIDSVLASTEESSVILVPSGKPSVNTDGDEKAREERLLSESGTSHTESISDPLSKLKIGAKKKKKKMSGAQRLKKRRQSALALTEALNTGGPSSVGENVQAGPLDLASTLATAVGGLTPKRPPLVKRVTGAQLKKRQKLKIAALQNAEAGTPKSTPVKRSRNELTPNSEELEENPQKKRHRLNEVKPSYSGSSTSVKMAIVHQDYPEVEVTDEQFRLIQASIMDKIDGQNTINPSFNGIRLNGGAVMLYCCDDATAGWVNSVCADMVPWQGALLKSVPASELAKGVRAMFVAPEILRDKTPEIILQKVDGQNGGFSTSKWRVLHTEKTPQGKRVVVRMDQDSWSTIQAKGFINLGFGRVTVTSLEKKSETRT